MVKMQEQIVELECASSSIDDIKEFAKQEECPIARIGYYYPSYVYIGEDETLYCEYKYKDEIGVFKTPAKILEDQLGNVYQVGVFKSKSE